MSNEITLLPPNGGASATTRGEPIRETRLSASTVTPLALAREPRRTLAYIIDRETARRKRRRLLLWGFTALLPVVAFFVWTLLQPKSVPFGERFRTVTVTRGDLVREVLATGSVSAVTTVQVGAEISGRIASVEVDYNSPVKAGQVLARFDRAALDSQLAQANGGVAAADAALQQARTDQEHAALSLDRAERLHKNQLVSEADYEAVVANARLAAQRVIAAQSQLAAQQGAARLARTNLDHATIVSPIDGIVITRNVDPGQTVASALQTPVLFTVAKDLRKMRVIAAVDEADIGEVVKDQHATFTVDAYPDRIFEGVVTEVRNSPVVVQDVVTYGTVIEVANADLALKPGMTTSVHVLTASADDTLKVPAPALHFTPPGEKTGGPASVWTIGSKDIFRRLIVKPGISDGEWTQILSGEVNVGDKIIVDVTPEGRKAYGLGN